MTRHIIRISLVILLGVVTSVAVAWGCTWRLTWITMRAAGTGVPLELKTAQYSIDIGNVDSMWHGNVYTTFGRAYIIELRGRRAYVWGTEPPGHSQLGAMVVHRADPPRTQHGLNMRLAGRSIVFGAR